MAATKPYSHAEFGNEPESSLDCYLAACSPDRIIALLDSRDRLTKALHKILAVNAFIRPSTGEVNYHGAWADCEAIARDAIAAEDGK